MIRFAVILTVFWGISVHAYALDFDISKDYSKNTLTVTGTAERNDFLSIVIMRSGVTLQDAWDSAVKTSEIHTFWDDYGIIDSVTADVSEPDDIAFLGITYADKKGNFSFETVIEDTSNYDIYVTSKKLNTTETKKAERFTNSGDYATLIAALNNEAVLGTESSFTSLLSANLSKLGFDTVDTGTFNFSDIAHIIYGEVKNNPLSTTDYEGNLKKYKESTRVIYLNTTGNNNITDDIADLLTQNSLYSYYENLVTTDAQKEYFSSKLTGKNLSSVSALSSKCTEAIILTVVKYPDGYINIKNVLSEIKNNYGISTLSTDNTVYSNLAGKDYNSLDAVIDAYKEYAAAAPVPTSPSGGGAGGGGYVFGNISEQIITPQVNNMKFIDLDTVSWAYEAISTLADKNIISGKSENKYVPNDNIKREEFVKLIVCAINEDRDTTNNNFSDVSLDAWYCKYVNRGYEIGIANGLGDKLFGVGENITRQDIAVLIYNALKYKSFGMQEGPLSFIDSDSIAGYAKNAVSALSQAGIINGYGDGSFLPTAYATRAEAAQLVFGMLNILK
jgi:hypothetical protein